MALYYSLIFGLLVTEMALFGLISLPLPSKFRKPLLTALHTPFQSQHFQIGMKCVFGFVLILFIDSLNRMKKINNELEDLSTVGGVAVTGAGSRLEIQSRRFYSQRNTYLCGFTLFLTLILNRTYSLVFELISIKEEIRKNNDASSLKKLDTADPVEVANLKKQIAEKDVEIENLKEKAEALSKEYEEQVDASSSAIRSRTKKA